MNVCETLLEILAEHNVKHIFGIPGDAINELIEAIRKQDKIRFIHVMHEESGAFAASAQACIGNVIIEPDEITWPPEISAAEGFNYLKAKVKEFFIR